MGRHDLRRQGASVIAGLLYCLITSIVVALGVALGVGYIPDTCARAHNFDYGGDYYANWDGGWYKDIARHGYSYKEGAPSSVAFFPAFPLCGRLLSRVSGLREEMALLVVANVFLAASFALFGLYLRERSPDAPENFHGYALVMMGILPTTFFFRMAYSESTFLVCEILSLYAIVRRWPLIVVTILIGLGTAARPVGIALVPALLLYIWDRSQTRWGFLLKSFLLVPLSCWGLAAYMGYQWLEFGDALAFAKTQANWAARKTPSAWTKLIALATLEPIWTLYNPAATGYWANDTAALDFPFSLRAADPIFFVGALELTIGGYVERRVSKYEALSGIFLMLIPYVTQGSEQHLVSMGRFSTVVLPVYIVLARIAVRLPAPVVAAMAALSGILLVPRPLFLSEGTKLSNRPDQQGPPEFRIDYDPQGRQHQCDEHPRDVDHRGGEEVDQRGRH